MPDREAVTVRPPSWRLFAFLAAAKCARLTLSAQENITKENVALRN
jgi:hypothetical protein